MINYSHVVARGFRGIIHGNIFNGAIWSVFDTILTSFLAVFSFFEKTTYCCRARRLSVRLSSVEIISFRGISISNSPIDLKIGLNVRKGVVHVRKA